MIDKNIKLALVAGGMLLLALFVLAVGVAYRAGYEAAVDDLAQVASTPQQSSTVPVPPTSTTAPPTQIAEQPSADSDDPEPTSTPTNLPTEEAVWDSSAAQPPPPPQPTATPTLTPTETLGEVRAHLSEPRYIYNSTGKKAVWAEMLVTISNVNVVDGVATGFTYLTPNPGGGIQYVTIFDVIHDEVPVIDLDSDAPLWVGWTQFSDGKKFYFAAGCKYTETIDAEGWEPIGDDPGGFFWEVHWTGGFFDCGNSQHDIPQQALLGPGKSATVPLYIYLMHPRLWEDKNWNPDNRSIAYLGLEVRDGKGRSLGIVTEYRMD